jgi:hypothetical protein
VACLDREHFWPPSRKPAAAFWGAMPGPKGEPGGLSVGGRLGRDGIAAATTIGAVQVDPRRDRLDRRQLHVVTPAREPLGADASHHQPQHGGSARKPLAGSANICPGKSPESGVYHFVTDETFEAAHGPPANSNPRHDRRGAPAPVLGQADAASSQTCGHCYRERHRVGAAPGAA